MKRRRAGATAACAALVVLGVGCQPEPSPWRSELVSIDATGTRTGNHLSVEPVFSPDGTKVAFVSGADDLGPTDTNGTSDIYLRDLTTGETTLVSTNAAGTQAANGQSDSPAFSPDGTKIAFVSNADDLGPTDTNGVDDVYLRDLTTGATTLVSVNGTTTDAGSGASHSFVFSADGTKIAFTTFANDLGPQDSSRFGWGESDVYVRDLVAETTTLVSADASGADSGDRESYAPVFSPAGDKVAFLSMARDLGPTDTNGWDDLYVRDLAIGTTELVSANASGTDAGDLWTSRGPVFSPDGTSLYFYSEATDLDPAAASSGIYVRDLGVGTTTLVAADTSVMAPILSADGNRLAFASPAGHFGPADTNGDVDVYVRDLQSGDTTLVSANAAGDDGGNARSAPLGFSPDGARLVFSSYATNLGPNDTDGTAAPEPLGDDTGNQDIYVRELGAGTTTMVSTNAAGTDSANHSSPSAVFSPDGSRLAWVTRATDLGYTDLNDHLATGPYPDVYVATFHGADLSVALRAGTASVPSGGELTYELDLHNAGPDAATGVVVGVLLPDGVRLTAAEMSGTACTAVPEHPELVVCDIATLESGGGAGGAVTVDVDAEAGATLGAIAAVASQTVDPDRTDNSAGADVDVVVAVP